MKSLKLAILAFVVLPSLFIACKKDGTEPAPIPTDSIEGVWNGKYGFGIETPDITYIFNIKPGGVIEELNGSGNSKGSGTWTLVGNEFKATYKWKAPMNTVFTVIATFDKSSSKLAGTWGYNTSNSNGGKWNMQKKN